MRSIKYLNEGYELIRKSDKEVIAIIKLQSDTSEYSMFAELWDHDSYSGNPMDENSFIASIYWKKDWCTHWNFYGSDYLPEQPDNDINPGYYHLCGSEFIDRFLTQMAFVRQVALKVVGDKYNDYTEKSKKIDELLLQDYEIAKCTFEEIEK